MKLIRDKDEAWLVELHAQGAELLERYRELLVDEVPGQAVAEILDGLLKERQRCLDALAARLRERDALPQAGDPDRAFVQALADALGAESPTLVERLDAAEARWQETLDDARSAVDASTWTAEDRRVLDRIAGHIADVREQLRSIDH